MQTKWIVSVCTLSVCARFMFIFFMQLWFAVFCARQSTWRYLIQRQRLPRLLWATKAMFAGSHSVSFDWCTCRNIGRILVGSDSGVTENYQFCSLLLLLLPFFGVYVFASLASGVFLFFLFCFRSLLLMLLLLLLLLHCFGPPLPLSQSSHTLLFVLFSFTGFILFLAFS